MNDMTPSEMEVLVAGCDSSLGPQDSGMHFGKEAIKDAILGFYQVKKQLDEGYLLEGVYPYCTQEGTPLYWRFRLKHPSTGEKYIRPLIWNGRHFEIKEPKFEGKKPLYGTDRIHDHGMPIWVVEGEPHVDAMYSLGLQAVTSGSASSANDADWGMLSGYSFIIWPDNDAPGLKYALDLQNIFTMMDCDHLTVDVSKLGLNDGDDVLDWLKNNPAAGRSEIMDLPVVDLPGASAATSEDNHWPAPKPLTEACQAAGYPLDALPDAIRSAVLEVHQFVQCPVAICATSALTSIAVACQGLANIKRSEGLVSPVSLFTLLVAESGERKSTVDGYFSRPYKDWIRDKEVEFAELMAHYEAEFTSWEAKSDALSTAIRSAAKNGEDDSDLQKRLAQLKTEEPKKPFMPRIFYTDSTAEAMAHGLAFGHPYGAVVSSEAGVVFGGVGMSAESATRYMTLINVLWDGGEHQVVRKTSESFTVRGARLTVGLAVQEPLVRSFLDEAGKNARGSGFLARFLIAWPDSTQGLRVFKEAKPDWPFLQAFNVRIRALMDMHKMSDGPDQNVISLSAEAKNIWIDFHDRVENKLAPKARYSNIRDIASKAADNAARVAALFHIFEFGPSGQINEDHVARAISIVQWHLDESLRFISGGHSVAVASQNAIKLIEWLAGHCERTNSSKVDLALIRQSGPNALRKTNLLKQVLAELEEMGWLRVTTLNKRKTVEVNPKILEDSEWV